jgi:hypothetical protein
LCEQLPQPEDGCDEGDDDEVVSRGFLVAGGDAAELLELGEAALDQVALFVERLVEVMLEGAGRVVGDDGDGAGLGDGGAEGVGVVGGIGEDRGRPIGAEQRQGLRGVAALAGGQDDPDGAAQATNGEVDLGARAATGAADGLILRPFFAPAACWCARTTVLSMIRYSKSGSSAMAVKTRCQTPLALQRLNRR